MRMSKFRNPLLLLALVAWFAEAWAAPPRESRVVPAGSFADVSVTIDNGTGAVETGQTTTYQVIASSNGPSDAAGVVTVDFPFGLYGCAWTCSPGGPATCPASGIGDIAEAVGLPTPAGGISEVTFTATCFVATSIPIPPPSTLSVPATVIADVTDPAPDNNSAVDTDNLIPVVDVAVSISDGISHAWYGQVVSYMIGIHSSGPADAIVRVVNTVPSSLQDCIWTCQSLVGNFCPSPASGAGSIDAELTLPALSGGSTELLRFTSECSVSNAALLEVVNTAQLQLAAPFRDDNLSNNQASDTDVLQRSVDLSATVSDGLQYVRIGDFVEYSIRIDNSGPNSGEFTYVTDALPDGVAGGLWTCTASAGATCHEGAGEALEDIITIPVGGHVTYLFSGVVEAQAFTKPIVNSVIALSDLDTFDPTPTNNVATDTDIVVLFRADFDPN